jgi:hypothetical protein
VAIQARSATHGCVTTASNVDGTDASKPKSSVSAQTVTTPIDEAETDNETSVTAPSADPGAPAESLTVLSMVGTARRAEAAPASVTPAAENQSAGVDQSLATTAASPLGTPDTCQRTIS